MKADPRTWRRRTQERALAWALALIVALGFIGIAAQASAAAPQDRLDEVTAWTAAQLRADVERRVLLPWDEEAYPELRTLGEDTVAAVPSHAPRIYARGRYIGELIRGRMSRDGLLVVLHEVLHRREHVAPPGTSEAYVEEGVTDALARDLYAAACARFRALLCRMGDPWSLGYPDEVRDVRAASMAATGSRTWRTYAARQWRRKLWAASPDGRRAMLEVVAQRSPKLALAA